MYDRPTSISVCSFGAIAGAWRKKSSESSTVHVQHFADGLALESDLQRLAVVAPAFADVARHVDIRQEMHLDFDDAVALTRLAASAFDVEAEAPGFVAAGAGFRHGCEDVADRREQAGVGRGFERGVRPIGL
jgi:hypothetical protein